MKDSGERSESEASLLNPPTQGEVSNPSFQKTHPIKNLNPKPGKTVMNEIFI